MRTLLQVIAFLAASLGGLGAAPLEVVVTCALPVDKQIWPLPAPTTSTVVDAEFSSTDELLKVRAGDWFVITRRIVYHATGLHPNYPFDEISFIMQERWPTPESGIVLKALDNPFTKDTKARFWISRHSEDNIWDIQTYEIWSWQFHRKPEA